MSVKGFIFPEDITISSYHYATIEIEEFDISFDLDSSDSHIINKIFLEDVWNSIFRVRNSINANAKRN